MQLTWLENYRKAGARFGVDLVHNPDCALEPQLAAKILVLGMTEGWFTGKKLASFFSRTVNDPVGARRTVNGTDRAEKIAGHHKAFLAALQAAGAAAGPGPVDPTPAKPDPVLERVAAVKRTQARLRELEFDIAVDGDAGPATTKAVGIFQHCRGDLAVDGIVGPKTRAALGL